MLSTQGIRIYSLRTIFQNTGIAKQTSVFFTDASPHRYPDKLAGFMKQASIIRLGLMRRGCRNAKPLHFTSGKRRGLLH